MPDPVVISGQVELYLKRLAPEPRLRIRRSLTGLASGRGDIRSLEEDLEGYYRLRVGKYRVVFRYGDDGKVQCVFIETRALVYQLFSGAKALLDPGPSG
jgi:mRNA interferase RelE/StbE